MTAHVPEMSLLPLRRRLGGQLRLLHGTLWPKGQSSLAIRATCALGGPVGPRMLSVRRPRPSSHVGEAHDWPGRVREYDVSQA